MHDKNSEHFGMVGWALHGAGLLALVLILGALFGIGYGKCIDQNDAIATRIDNLRMLIDRSATVRSRHDEVRNEFNSLQHSVQSTRKRLSASLDELEFENELERVARETGFQLESSQIGTPTTVANCSQTEVDIVGNGSFASICRFLDGIDQFAKLAKISHLDIESNSDPNHYPVNVTFVLVHGAKSHDRD